MLFPRRKAGVHLFSILIPVKKFLFKTLLTASFCLCISAIVIIALFVRIRGKADFELDRKADMIILGHSHPACAFDDSKIDNTKNLAQMSEAYFYTYYKLRLIKRDNENINTVFVEFTNNNLDNSISNWIWGKEHLSSRFHFFFPFIETKDLQLIIKNNREDFQGGVSMFLRSAVISIVASDYNQVDDLGGYSARQRPTDVLLDDFWIAEKDSSKQVNISEESILYLKKIVRFCEKNEIRLFFVRSPQHQYYRGRGNEKAFQALRKARFSEVKFLDFNNFPISDDGFVDYEHLSETGATQFSMFFDSLVKTGLLEQEFPQKFIELKMAKWNEGL